MKPTIIPLPGILSRGPEQYMPLDLERYGDVEWLDYKDFSPKAIIKTVADRAEQLRLSGRPVILIGSSLGGCLAAFIVERLRSQTNGLDWLRVIIVDAPSGAKTFKGFEKLPSWLITSWFGAVFLRVFGALMMWISRIGPGLPKDAYITKPPRDVVAWLTGDADMSLIDWQKWVKQTAKECLRGHSASVWARQIRWMTSIGDDGSLGAAAVSLIGVHTVYIACTDGNDVVTQPDAASWWQCHTGARVLQVRAPHCGYLQMQHEFWQAFHGMLVYAE